MLAVACNRTPRECGEVTAAIAADDVAIAAALSGDAKNLVARARAVGDTEDATLARLSSVPKGDAELADALADYVAVSRELAAAARAFAASLAAADDEARTADALVVDVAAAQDALRRSCATPSADCAALEAARAPVVGPGFQGADRTAQIDLLSRAAGAVDALRPKDPALGAGCAAYATVLRRWVDDLRHEGAVTSQVEHDEQRFGDVALRRKPIEDRIHAACGAP